MRSRFLTTAIATGLAFFAISVNQRAAAPTAAAFPNDDKTIIHVLNRLGFGPRPGDVEKVRAMGLQTYIERQLHPERITDTAMDARLAGFTTVGLSSRAISEQFEQPLLEA